VNLPTGTVTFLFTDIEGSTRLWDEQPEFMELALARHDALLRAVIEQHEGHVFKTIGDAFCAAFPTASGALRAALVAQQALLSESWPESVVLSVRMALHTGAVEARDNDFFGRPLNRVARLLAAAHGGQVLLSLPTEELTRDMLPAFTSLKALGEHRLRDLSRVESVFQLVHPDLPSNFPRLKSLDHLPNNLPLQLTSFIGREKEIIEVKQLGEKTRLLTLTGSGGCGKTRLALQVAADVLEQFADGVWLVELASLTDPGLVTQTVAQALGVKELVGQDILQTLISNLYSKRLLIVIDNCEHVLDACAQLSDSLLRTCLNVKILTSSREGLGIAGELTYRVPALSLPGRMQTISVERLSRYEAVQLFIERALFHLPAFAVTHQNAPALASVCYRLDGIPLAIELAAAKVRSLTLEEINTRLANCFRLLTGGSRTALPRQQTLRALIDWSYNLLSPQEKVLLLRLSVFAGGWTLLAAEQVCAGERIEDGEIFDLLTGLVDKSLVIAETSGEATRYRLLETVRQYTRDRLVEEDRVITVRSRHRDYFLTLAEGNCSDTILEEEHDNLRQALTFCEEEADGGKAGLRLGAALTHFWKGCGRLTEGREHLTAMLSHPGAQEPIKVRADVLYRAGNFAYFHGDCSSAHPLYEESRAIYQKLGHPNDVAWCLRMLGMVVYTQGDYALAHSLLEQSLTLFREEKDRSGIADCLNSLALVAKNRGDYALARSLQEEGLTIQRDFRDKFGIADGLNNLGLLVYSQGDYVLARAMHEEALALRRELGNKRGIAASLSNLGIVAATQGDYAVARSMQEESITIYREVEDRLGMTYPLHYLGEVAKEQGDYAYARNLQAESLRIRWELGYRRGTIYCLEAFASLAFKEENQARAVRLWGASAALREALGSLLLPDERENLERELAAVRKTLDESIYAARWEEGRAMTWEQAIAEALWE